MDNAPITDTDGDEITVSVDLWFNDLAYRTADENLRIIDF